jgi:hypothetical protein
MGGDPFSSLRSLLDPVASTAAAAAAAAHTARSGSGTRASTADCRARNTALSRRADSGMVAKISSHKVAAAVASRVLPVRP